MSDKVAAAMHGAFDCPDSEAVLPADPSRSEWLAARLNGLGGSEISAILNLSRWATPRDVYLDKIGAAPETEVTWAMIKGSTLEPALINWFVAKTGIPAKPIGLQRNKTRPWMLGSVDALSGDGGIIECKTANWHMRDEWDDEQVSDHAELQSQWYMAVTGRTHAWVVAAVSDDDPVIRRVERDDKLIGDLITAAGRFWHDYVLTATEPPATGVDLPKLRKAYSRVNRKVVEGDDKQDQLIRQRQDACRWVKHYESVQADAEAKLLDHFKDADHLVINGEVAATWKQQTARRLSAALLVEDGIDVEQYKTESTSRVLRIPAKRAPLKGN